MTNQLRNVPDLRFPGFEGEWEESNIDNEFDFFNNKRKPIKENLRNKGEYPYYGATGIIDYVDDFIFDGNFILIGEDGANIVSRSAPLVYFATGKFWVNNHAHILYPKFGDIYFNYLLLENIDYEKYNTGTAQPKLNVQNLKKIKIKSPRDNSEQQKIGEFFSKLDRQIELEEQKLEKLEEQKKGYMQKLFSQEIRFKDNKGNNYPDWKIVEIGDILEERTERSGEGDMLSVTINNGIIKFDEIDRKDNSSKDKSNYRKVYKDDIAYNSMRMWQGASGKSEYEGIVSPAYTVTIPSENINPDFIAYYFKTHKMIHKFKINSQGLTSDTWNLKYRQLKDIKLNLCSKEEQNKIANLLIMYDKLINKQKHKLEILKTNKKGFLQKMFI